MSSERGFSSALKPRINRRLTLFVPAILPIARAPLPRVAASIPIANSGALVPMETNVKPMMIGETPRRAAKREPPRTMSSAPAISAIRPNISKATAPIAET
jgi:hypothetical protein